MKKIKFQNGTLISKAKVTIDNMTYDVEPAEYEGTTPLSAETLNEMQDNLLQLVFPIGSTYITQNNTNPSEILEFGVWERLKGKVCLGLDEADEDLDEIGKTGGEKEHALTIKEMPSHNHKIIPRNTTESGLYEIKASNATGEVGDAGTTYTGGDKAHNNMQPYEVVGYMWIRRA